MKSWLIPTAIVALMIAGATAGAFAFGEGDGEPVFESSGDTATQLACEPGASECEDTLDTCDPVPLRSDCGIDPDVCNQVHNIGACDGPVFSDTDEPAAQDTGDLLTNDLGDDNDSACDPVPLRSDCGIDPNECNMVHNITACSGPSVDGVGPIVMPGGGTAHYEVVVRYNTSVTQPDLDETAGYLRGFDAGLDFIVQESWPPTGVASVQTDTRNFCDAIFDTLASQSYITDFSCGPQRIFDGGVKDAPVTNLPDVE